MKRLIGALLALFGIVTIHAQSLADVAKQAEDARAATATEKASGKPSTTPTTKVYTNKDLKDTPASSVIGQTKTESVTKDAPSKTPADTVTDRPSRDEAYWRARIAPLTLNIRANVERTVPLKARIEDLTRDLLGIGPLNARRGGVETERQRLITEVQALDQIISADTKAEQAIEEEARRDGALPGWFRP